MSCEEFTNITKFETRDKLNIELNTDLIHSLKHLSSLSNNNSPALKKTTGEIDKDNYNNHQSNKVIEKDFKLIILIGISGSGKTHTLKTLKERYEFQEIIQYTSRPMRSYEFDGEDYHFVSSGELEKNEKFIVKEYKTVFGNWFYGIHIENLLKSLRESNKRQILVTDFHSAVEVRDLLLHNNIGSKIIFLNPPVQEVIERLKMRGDNLDEVNRRLITDFKDYQHAHWFSDLEIVETSHRKVIKTIKRFAKLD